MELPLSLLSPPAAGPSNAAASTSTPPAAGAVPVVPVKKDTKKKHHLTTATDPLFAELRDLNFSSVGKKLNKVARRLDEDYKVSVYIWKNNEPSFIFAFEDKPSDKDSCSAKRFRWETWWSPN